MTMIIQDQQNDDNTILLSREHIRSGQYHVIEILAKALDQNVTEYLRETLLEAVENYAQSDMISDILERELGLKKDRGEIMPKSNL
jgi:hypothetical protein